MRHQYKHCGDPPWSLYLIDPPEGAVVSKEDMKQHLRIDSSDDDDLVELMTAAVTQHLDGRDGKLGRALLDQTWEMRMEWFPQIVRIPLPPLIEVEAIEYLDDAGARQPFDSTKYVVTGEGGRGRVQLLRGQCWPLISCNRPEAAIVRFRAGYLDGNSPPQASVPAPIVAAIKMMTGTLYANREHVVLGTTAIEIPWAAAALLADYWIPGA